MLSKGVAFCIGEFGDFQNGGDVDEATIMQYCTEKGHRIRRMVLERQRRKRRHPRSFRRLGRQ